ncbi:MAG: flagellar motor switch protein FliG [Spirochaetia bacterium]
MMKKKGIQVYQRVAKLNHPQSVGTDDSTSGASIDSKSSQQRVLDAATRAVSHAKKMQGKLPVRSKKNPSKKSQKSGSRKAAELLLLVGKDEAASILQHMSIEEVRSVVYELALIKDLNPSEANQTLSEFGREANERGIYSGGVDIARGFLKVAFGEQEGERILRNAAGDLLDRPFVFLEDLEATQLLAVLKDESVETLSVILPRIKPHIAKLVLEHLDAVRQPEVVKRIAGMQRVDSSVIIRIEEILRERIRQQGGAMTTSEIDGRQALANILRYMTVTDEKKLLGELAQEQPEMAKSVEEHLFTIDSLLYMTNRDLHDIFHRLDEREIAVLLKGKSEEVRQRILESLSSRKRTHVLEEEQNVGPMRKKEVEKATREFLDSLKDRERDGKLVVLRPGESLV